jgi:phage virion morphogenesis protein
MLGFNVRVDEASLQGVIERLEAVLEAGDIDQIADEAAAIMLNRLRERFLAEKGPDGSPWEPSKAAIKRRREGGSGTLFKTGRLFQSIQLSSEGPGERSIGTDVPYAGFHNFGTRSLPARPFMFFSDDDVAVAEQLVIRRIKEAVA